MPWIDIHYRYFYAVNLILPQFTRLTRLRTLHLETMAKTALQQGAISTTSCTKPEQNLGSVLLYSIITEINLDYNFKSIHDTKEVYTNASSKISSNLAGGTLPICSL